MPKDNCNTTTPELWVAPDLTLLETTHHTHTDSYLPWGDASGVRVYWRLTAAVYAWVVRKMRAARAAADAGRLGNDDWQRLQARFAAVRAAVDGKPDIAARLQPDAVQAALAEGSDLPKRDQAEMERRVVAFLRSVDSHSAPCVGLIVDRDGHLELVNATGVEPCSTSP